ncbi:MAG: fasciclin domain-containing protein [Candidatus Melainabacteria bacterium]|nr:fasciclin domain-containing protein [Candidatus Melainabacteria bacterium]
MKQRQIGAGVALTTLALVSFSSIGFAKDVTTSGKMSTSETQDIVNTLRTKGNFHKMLSGLEIAFDLDNELKGKGPFTVFAADDKAWAKINQADQDTLFNNKNKLAQVLSYQVLKGDKLDSKALESMTAVKSMEGHEIKLSIRKDDDKKTDGLYVDKARVKDADIQCSNGIIHIVDQPIMPPLAE